MIVRDVKISAIVDALNEAKLCLLTLLTSEVGSPERLRELDRLSEMTKRARVLADAYEGKLTFAIRLSLTLVEFALGQARARK
jgi:hypothetical protein